MSTTPAPKARPVGSTSPRVREQARDAAAVMVFSAALSLTAALGLLLLAHLGG